MKSMLNVDNIAHTKKRSAAKVGRYFCVKYLFGFIIYKKIIFHFSVEEMGQKDEHSKPHQGKNKFSDKTENGFNFCGMISPEPIFKPALESIREGTTTAIITVHTHVDNPFAFS